MQAVRFMDNTNPEGAKNPQQSSAIYNIKQAEDAEQRSGELTKKKKSK